MNDLRKGARVRRVVTHRIRKLRRDVPLDEPYFERFPNNQELWLVNQVTQLGSRPETTNLIVCESKKDAERFVEDHPEGSETPDKSVLPEIPGELQEKFREFVSEKLLGRFVVGTGGDEDGYLAWKVTNDAGLNDGINISREVSEYLGPQRIDELRENFGDNWNVVAELEFSYFNLPHSSPAHIACLRQYCYFVLQDDYLAGYHQRDLEILVAGVEQSVERVNEMRKNAGKRGGAHSNASRTRRRVALIEAMEATASANPDILKFLDEKTLAEVAAKQAKERDPSLWRQGFGQVQEYLGEVRRGEAGDELRQRLMQLIQ